jgi:hypothetical protein
MEFCASAEGGRLAFGASTHQYKRSVVEQILRIDICSFRNHLLTYFQVAPSTCLAQSAEVLAIVEWVVLFEDAILDQFLFFMQTFDAISN